MKKAIIITHPRFPKREPLGFKPGDGVTHCFSRILFNHVRNPSHIGTIPPSSWIWNRCVYTPGTMPDRVRAALIKQAEENSL